MRIRPSLFAMCSLFIFILLQVGCLSAPAPVLKLGTNLWPGYEPLYLARERGLLDADKVTLVELLSASEVMRAFRNGAIDAAALTLDEVIVLREVGLKPVIVQVTDVSAGADVILAHPGINEMTDLRGRKIGVEATALGAYMLSRALSLNNMTLADLDVVPLEANEHSQAFLQHRVDAVVTFEPVRRQLLEAGAVQLFDSGMIPGEIVDVLVVREGLLDSHHRQIQHLIQVWHQSLALIQAQPEQSAHDMTSRLGLTPNEVLGSLSQLEMPGWESSNEMMAGPSSPLVQQARKLADIMHHNRLIDEVPDLEGLVYSHYPDA